MLVGIVCVRYRRKAGVVVLETVEGSSAFKCGLREGDVITHVGPRPAGSMKEFHTSVRDMEKGQGKVMLKIARKGGIRFVTVEKAKWFAKPARVSAGLPCFEPERFVI